MENCERLLELMQMIFSGSATAPSAKALNPYLGSTIWQKHCEPGEIIAAHGEVLPYLMIVVSGSFYVVTHGRTELVTTFAKANAPDMLGATQIFSDDPVGHSDIIAAEDCQLLCIDKAYFYRCTRQQPQLALVVLSQVSRVMQKMDDRVQQALLADPADKLLLYIYRRWVQTGRLLQGFTLAEKHAVIAGNMGISVRTLYRAINKLEQERLVEVQKGGAIRLQARQVTQLEHSYYKLAKTIGDGKEV